MTFDRGITGLLVIDPYNDFISEGGKVWDRLKKVAEANGCVPHMKQVLDAARQAEIRVFYALHRRYRPGDYETWKYIAPIQKRTWSSKAFEYGTWGGESAKSSNLNRVKPWSSSIGVRVGSPTRNWICNSRSMESISSSLPYSSHTRVWKQLFVMRLSWATTSQWSETRRQTIRT